MTRRQFRRRVRHEGRWGDERSDPMLEMAAGQSSTVYKRNGRLRFGWRDRDELGHVTSCLSGFAVVYRYYAVVFHRYCEESRLTPKQLRLIEALMIEGASLREFAGREGVTPQAISARINSLANKAPEFYRWWRNTNASHQRSPNACPPEE